MEAERKESNQLHEAQVQQQNSVHFNKHMHVRLSS
jgi:hypothetical protein